MACFVVTGGAGFIGSHLVQALLGQDHEVRVIDDFSTGRRSNLKEFVGRFRMFKGSVCDAGLVRQAMRGAHYCLHQAALPSVSRSLKDPVATNRANVEGAVVVFQCAQEAGLKRVVCASSSSVFGNSAKSSTTEQSPMRPISPYGVSKAAVELYAEVFSGLYDLDVVSLRYFNVFGPRQNPGSAYAAVIPSFIERMISGRPPIVHGDGNQSRDFSYVENVVNANLLCCEVEKDIHGAYNIACGTSTSILELVGFLNEILETNLEPQFVAARPGDITKSVADTSRAHNIFGYSPSVHLRDGLALTTEWYLKTV